MTQPSLPQIIENLSREAAFIENWAATNKIRGIETEEWRLELASCLRGAQRILQTIQQNEDAFRSVFKQLAARKSGRRAA